MRVFRYSFHFPYISTKICCGYSLELLMCTHNNCYCGEVRKIAIFLVKKSIYLEFINSYIYSIDFFNPGS